MEKYVSIEGNLIDSGTFANSSPVITNRRHCFCLPNALSNDSFGAGDGVKLLFVLIAVQMSK